MMQNEEPPGVALAPSAEEGEEVDNIMVPLMAYNKQQQQQQPDIVVLPIVRSRKGSSRHTQGKKRRRRRLEGDRVEEEEEEEPLKCCGRPNRYAHNILQSTLTFMNFLARVLLWASIVAMAAGVVWYSRELKNNGTDPHLIAWFSAGAFVLLGFPISIYGILMHLSHYYQPDVQCYVVRILWMVPLYSIESWLCLRFHAYAIYIETLRDCYESYVLYCFLQFLISVLGGEDELVLMLKDKSPTRGVHMWGLQWCVRPWLMGQPVSRSIASSSQQGNGVGGGVKKTVKWTSPFFVKCKFGVLQYVLLKFVSSLFVMILELNGLYKEGDFTPKGGYLYICILTNLSQCWALYCLIFFYYATKNELSPIRPVGKFLSVKALVFFTWWQSVAISMLYQMDMIPHYASSPENDWSSEDVAKGLQDYLICIEMFLAAIVHTFVFPHTDHSSLAARSLMTRGTGASHNHNHYHGNHKRLGRKGRPWKGSILGYHRGVGGGDDSWSKNSAVLSANHPHDMVDLELGTLLSSAGSGRSSPVGSGLSTTTPPPPGDGSGDDDIPAVSQLESSMISSSPLEQQEEAAERRMQQALSAQGDDDEDGEDEDDDEETEEEDDFEQESPEKKQQERHGFVRALLESTLPLDVMDNTVGIVKGDYVVEKKTLLHHAATSDQYDLFSSSSKRRRAKGGGAKPKSLPSSPSRRTSEEHQ